jgi:hypothetical protein
VQLDPPATLDRLTQRAVDRTVASALADPTVASALANGDVERVLVQAAATGMPGGAPAGAVAFLFAAPVTPASSPYEVLCDIAGQTPQWSGVAARVELERGQVESSPIWLTGANCVGMVVP